MSEMKIDPKDFAYVAICAYDAYPPLFQDSRFNDNNKKWILYKYIESGIKGIPYIKAQEKPVLRADSASELKIRALLEFGKDILFSSKWTSVCMSGVLSEEDMKHIRPL